MTLYEIDTMMMNCLDTDTGEIIDEESLAGLQMERDVKIENIGCWIKNLKAESDAIAGEIKSLQSRKKVADNKADSLRKYLQEYLQGNNFTSPRLVISYRKSESVEISDIHDINPIYLKFKEPEPDKVAIKKALKSGHKVKGARLVVNQNMQIK